MLTLQNICQWLKIASVIVLPFRTYEYQKNKKKKKTHKTESLTRHQKKTHTFSMSHRKNLVFPKNETEQTTILLQRPNQSYHPAHYYVLSYHTIRLSFLLLIATLWAVFLIFLATARITHGSEGLNEYVRHFTYWSLSVQIIFYVLAVIGLVIALFFRYEIFLYYIYLFVFWITFGMVILVFWTMPVLLHLNPGILLLNMKSFGGTFEDGNVLVANYLYHYAPMGILLFYTIVSFREIESAYAYANDKIFPQEKGALGARVLYIVAYVFAPIIIFFIYHAIFDYEEIYQVDFPEYLAILAGLILVFFFSSLLITLAAFYHYPYAESSLTTETETPEERKIIRKWLQRTDLCGSVSLSSVSLDNVIFSGNGTTTKEK